MLNIDGDVRSNSQNFFFLTSEISFRSENSLPRVVFGTMFREGGCLPWVLLRGTDKNKGGEI